MAKHEDYPQPTPTQAELDAIKRGETGVTDQDESEAEKDAQKSVDAEKPAGYKTRQAKAD